MLHPTTTTPTTPTFTTTLYGVPSPPPPPPPHALLGMPAGLSLAASPYVAPSASRVAPDPPLWNPLCGGSSLAHQAHEVCHAASVSGRVGVDSMDLSPSVDDQGCGFRQQSRGPRHGSSGPGDTHDIVHHERVLKGPTPPPVPTMSDLPPPPPLFPMEGVLFGNATAPALQSPRTRSSRQTSKCMDPIPPEAETFIRSHFGNDAFKALICQNSQVAVSTLRVDGLRVPWCVKRVTFRLPAEAQGYRFSEKTYTAHHLCWFQQGGEDRSPNAQKAHIKPHKATVVTVCAQSDTEFQCTFSNTSGCTGCPLYADLKMIRDGRDDVSVRVGPLLVLSRKDQAVKREFGPWGESLQLRVEESYEAIYKGRRVTLKTRGKRSPSERKGRKGEVTKKSRKG